MYRLTAATGSFTDNNNTDFPFTLEMSYTASGNIATKNVTADILSADNTVSQLAYEGNYTYNTGQSHTIATITGTGIDQAFTWDQNGNLSTHTDNIKSLNRYLCWDEENRLMAVKDQNYLSAYVYDAAGERVWKLSGEVTQMKINGVGTIDVASLSNKTLYVSPYVVYNEQGYSKHYYAGAERVSSRIGGGTMYGLMHPINDTVTPITDEYPELASRLWGMLQRSFTDCLDLEAEYISMEFQLPSVLESANQNNPEPNWYIYHSDHLGSSSFLTDANGDPTQHLQYLPFGENYIEQRATTDYYTPYTFSAKERDPETGYSYFGARYYDPNVSIWLSVDPMADERPFINPYNYCRWNPLRYIDPDGKLEEEIYEDPPKFTDPKGSSFHAGEGYKQTSDGQYLYGEGLQTKVWDENLISGAVTTIPGGYINYDGPDIDFDTYNPTKFESKEADINFGITLATLMVSEAARDIPGIVTSIGTVFGVIGGIVGAADNIYDCAVAAKKENIGEAVYQGVQAAGYVAGTILLFTLPPVGMAILLTNSLIDVGEFLIVNWGKE